MKIAKLCFAAAIVAASVTASAETRYGGSGAGGGGIDLQECEHGCVVLCQEWQGTTRDACIDSCLADC